MSLQEVIWFDWLSISYQNHQWPCEVHQNVTIPGALEHQSNKRGFISPKSVNNQGFFFYLSKSRTDLVGHVLIKLSSSQDKICPNPTIHYYQQMSIDLESMKQRYLIRSHVLEWSPLKNKTCWRHSITQTETFPHSTKIRNQAITDWCMLIMIIYLCNKMCSRVNHNTLFYLILFRKIIIQCLFVFCR